MEKISLLVDTDIFIDYFNEGRFSNILENDLFLIYFSAVTEKELLSKKGLNSPEKEAILYTLKNYRRIRINNSIAHKYSELRKKYPALDKEDLLIAATARVSTVFILASDRSDANLPFAEGHSLALDIEML